MQTPSAQAGNGDILMTKHSEKTRDNKPVGCRTGAQYIAGALDAYGVTHVFFMEAILRGTLVEMEKLGIRRILTHSEKAAAYMADGYARVSRKPGLCMAQSVGAANLAAGLQDPFLGHIPVIALTGRKAPASQYRNAYQEIPHLPMFAAVTKFNASVETAEQLPFLLRQAFREATSGAPGPVHLDMPGHVGQTADRFQMETDPVVEQDYGRYPAHRPFPDPDDIAAALKLLAEAKKPVIIAGGGVAASAAGPMVRKLAEKLSIPVATSMSGRGTIPENHPLSVGVVGSYARATANKIVAEADCVLFIGSNTGDMVTDGWKLPGKGARVIQIDINPCELGRNLPLAKGIMADAGSAAGCLLEAADAKHKKSGWAEYAAGVMADWRREVAALRNAAGAPVRTERLCKEISDALPADAILVADTGYSSIWTCSLVDLNHAGQTYIRAAGSLGWSFPAALGAKCAAPERPVFCFTGDGGFFYHLCELETAARRGINTITVVNNNGCMSQCAVGVGKAYGNNPGNRDEMFRYRRTDFAAIARDFGCLGIRVEKPEELKKAFQEALKAERPVLVDVVTDENSKPHFEPSY